MSVWNFRIGVTFVEASFVGLCYKNVLMMPVQRALNHTAGLTLPESGILPWGEILEMPIWYEMVFPFFLFHRCSFFPSLFSSLNAVFPAWPFWWEWQQLTVELLSKKCKIKDSFRKYQKTLKERRTETEIFAFELENKNVDYKHYQCWIIQVYWTKNKRLN